MAELTRFGRQVIKVPVLAGVLLLHVPLAAISVLLLLKRRPPLQRSGRFTIVVPFEPGDSSGGARAVKDLIGLFTERIRPDVMCLSSSDRNGRGIVDAFGKLLSWPLPIPKQCRRLPTGDHALDRRLSDGGTVLFEFTSAALALYLRPRPRAHVIVRDHEVLPRKLAMEYRQARGVAALVHALRLAVCWVVTLAVYARVDRVVTLTDEDRDWLVRYLPTMRDRTVTIPVPFLVDVAVPPAPRQVPARDLLMIANFFHTPNVDAVAWFVRECAPHLEPGFTLHLCGLDTPLDAVDLSSNCLSIVRHGFVDDPSTAVPGAAIAVAPVVSGGGVRMKNLLLASLRKVVVTTPLGNEGIGFVDGRDAIIADSGSEMARRINEVSRSSSDIARLGEAARSFVQSHFSPAAVLDRFEREVLATGTGEGKV